MRFIMATTWPGRHVRCTQKYVWGQCNATGLIVRVPILRRRATMKLDARSASMARREE
jgi:hypothetical protein